MRADRRELLDAFIAAWTRRDVGAALDLMSEDCEFRTSVGPDPGSHYRGRAEVERAFRAFLDPEPDPRTTQEPPSILVADDFAVTRWVTRTPSADRTIVTEGCDVFTFHGGAISSKDTYRKVRGDPPC